MASYPGVVNASSVKAKLLKPSTTSHFVLSMFLPSNTGFNNFLSSKGISNSRIDMDQIDISCSDAFLPGSSLTTSDVNDDFHGVTERYAYRRLYDNQTDFTFYVDAPTGDRKGYTPIYLFEQWISYIVGEEQAEGLQTPNYFYRVNYPKNYRVDFELHKFERDYDLTSLGSPITSKGTGGSSGGNSALTSYKNYLKYRFKSAFPISIASMPVSYDSSQYLKCTVSFTYSRYIVTREPNNLTSIGNPVVGKPNNQFSTIFDANNFTRFGNVDFNTNRAIPQRFNSIAFGGNDSPFDSSLSSEFPIIR